MSRWNDPEGWSRLLSGEDCPICRSIGEEGVPLGTVAEMEVSYLTSRPSHAVHGYCCLVLKRHAIELHDLKDDEADSFMRDARLVGRALQEVTGAVKMNLEIHGNTIPHLHAHFFPRYVGDRFEGGPVDPRQEPFVMDEFGDFVAGLRAALGRG
jgi:diadenosine tetraphosphate (Ap4A) HIT family hydrolase